MAKEKTEKRSKTTRTQVTLPKKVWDILEEEYLNILGTKRAEIIEKIVIIFLTERGHFNPKMMLRRTKNE
jgi:metal-responsive CopG/Arc/MetJ family transcriptional regulator